MGGAALDPVVRWGVYAASFRIGGRLLGPVPEGTEARISAAAGPEVARRLLVENVVLAVVFAVVGYLPVLRFVRAYCRREFSVVDRITDAVAE